MWYQKLLKLALQQEYSLIEYSNLKIVLILLIFGKVSNKFQLCQLIM